MSGALGYAADASCAINTTLQSGGVCLGPGKLCVGGRYVSGDYDYAVCEYDVNFSPYVLLILIILCVISFDELRSILENKVPKDYRPVITSFFAELATLGFVSLVVFLVERSWVPNGKSVIDLISESLNLGYTLKKTLHRLHFQLFGVSVCFIIMSLLLLRYLLIEFGRFKKWSVQLEEGMGDFHQLPKIGLVELDTRWTFLLPHKLKQEREIFLRLFERFTDPKQITPGDIPVKPTFSLGEYFMLCSSHTVSHILHINPWDWLFVLLLSLWPFLAYYGSTGVSSDIPDASFPIFWLYEASLLIFSLCLDWKIHTVLMSVVPNETVYEPAVPETVDDLVDFSRGGAGAGAGGDSNRQSVTGHSLLQPQNSQKRILSRGQNSSGRSSSPATNEGGGSRVGTPLQSLAIQDAPVRVHGRLASVPLSDGGSIKRSSSAPSAASERLGATPSGGVDNGAGVLSAGDVVLEVLPIGMRSLDGDVGEEEVADIREANQGVDVSKLLKAAADETHEGEVTSPATNGSVNGNGNGNGSVNGNGNGNGSVNGNGNGISHAAPNGIVKDTLAEVESTVHVAIGPSSGEKQDDAEPDFPISVSHTGMPAIAESAALSPEVECEDASDDAAIEASTAVAQKLEGAANGEIELEPASPSAMDGSNAVNAQKLEGAANGEIELEPASPSAMDGSSAANAQKLEGAANGEIESDPASDTAIHVDGSNGAAATVSASHFGYGNSSPENISESSRFGESSPSGPPGSSRRHRGWNWGSVREARAQSGLWVDADEAPGARVSFEVAIPGNEGRASALDHRMVPRFIKHHAKLADRSSLQRYLGGEIINAHQSLFWFGSHGPAFFTRAVRMIAVASMVILTIALETYSTRMLCTGVSDLGECDQATAGGVILLLVSIVPPIVSVLMLPQMIKKLVIVTNVETMKDRQVILQVVNRTRNHNMRKVMSTLISLGNVIDRVRGLTELAKGNRGRGSAEFLRNSSEFVRNHAKIVGEGGTGGRTYEGAWGREERSSNGRPSISNGRPSMSTGRPSLENVSRASLDFGKKIANATRGSLDLFRNKRSNSWDDAFTALPPREEELKNFVAKMDKPTVDNLRELFDEVDVGHKGALDKDSLAKLLEATGTWVGVETCDFLFDIMDLQRNGKVSFEEFASVFYQQKSRKKDPMQLADQMWNLFDPKNTGVITTVTVEATLNRTFPKYDTADILRLLRHLDYENLGVVERSRFQEYVSTVFKEQGLGDGQ